MSATLPTLSEDQAEAWDRLAHQLEGMGIDLVEGTITPRAEGKASVLRLRGVPATTIHRILYTPV
jgi:exodeoxyribonuclease-5